MVVVRIAPVWFGAAIVIRCGIAIIASRVGISLFVLQPVTGLPSDAVAGDAILFSSVQLLTLREII